MDYQNFDLSIENKVDGHYSVKAESQTMGEVEGELSLRHDPKKMAAEVKSLAEGSIDQKLLMKFGESLYDGLFCEGVKDLYRESLGQVHGDDQKGLRIRLMITPPEISALPWELLYDERAKCFLATSGKTPLTRYIKLFEPIKALKIKPPIRVLVMIPANSGLDVEKEKEIVLKALGELKTVEVSILDGNVTRSKISEAIVEQQYHILHFIGHGVFHNDEGHLVINSEAGGQEAISAEAFADFFRDYSSMKLVILNSCQGAEVSATRPLAGMAPQLVARGIPAVIAMQYSILDEAALLFAKEFYLKLCKGWNRGRVDAAVSHARNRIRMDVKEAIAFATPVLFMRSSTGVIFDIEEQEKLFSSPSKNINRLKEVKKIHQENIDLLHELRKDSTAEGAQAADEEIEEEQRSIAGIDRRIWGWYKTAALAVASLLIFFASFVGLFDVVGLDEFLETKFIAHMDSFVDKKFDHQNVRLVLADEDGNDKLGKPKADEDWRGYSAEMIKGLSEAGARVVAFDVIFGKSTTNDGLLAEAINGAAERGTLVIAGKDIDEDGVVKLDVTDVVKNALKERWGNVRVGGESRWTHLVRTYRLAQKEGSGSSATDEQTELAIVPSLALQAIIQFHPQSQLIKPYFNADENEIRLREGGPQGRIVRAIPVNDDISFAFDLADRDHLSEATRPYSDTLRYAQLNDTNNLREFQGKIVLIGYRTEELREVSSTDKRFGVEVQANVVSNILQEVYIRSLSTFYDFFIITLMAAIGALLQTLLRGQMRVKIPLKVSGFINKDVEIPVPLVAVTIIYLLSAFLIFKYNRIVLGMAYHIAALFFTYWLVGLTRGKLGLKRS